MSTYKDLFRKLDEYLFLKRIEGHEELFFKLEIGSDSCICSYTNITIDDAVMRTISRYNGIKTDREFENYEFYIEKSKSFTQPAALVLNSLGVGYSYPMDKIVLEKSREMMNLDRSYFRISFRYGEVIPQILYSNTVPGS